MSTASSAIAICGRLVVPVDRPTIDFGAVVVAGGQIVAVDRWKDLRGQLPAGYAAYDFGDAAILPAFVNTHVHLDLSDCAAPIPAEGQSFASWIRSVVAHRGQRGGYRPEIVREGLAECFRFGTTAIGDIAQPGCQVEDYRLTLPPSESDEAASGGPDAGELSRDNQRQEPSGTSIASRSVDRGLAQVAKGNVFAELIAPLADQKVNVLQSAAEFLGLDWPEGLRPGLAPHAPYTVHPSILEEVVRLAKDRNVPVCFHLAESRDERELIGSGGGPLRELLEERGLWSPSLVEGMSFARYLRILAEAPRALIIHGNFLSREDFEFLAGKRHMFIVHCPRSFRHFAWGRFRLQQLLMMGVQVVIGTDGRSSAPDLNMGAELSLLCRWHRSISRSKLLRLATLEAARALGVDHRLGSITPGKDADLVIYPFESSFEPLMFLESLPAAPLAFMRDGVFLSPQPEVLKDFAQR